MTIEEATEADIVTNESLDDPLLGCLLIITKLENNPRTADELISGLPLVDNRLTPELFSRAAKRVGIQSKIVYRTLERIPQLVLPAVLVLKDNQACVLEHIDFKTNKARIIQPLVAGEGSSSEANTLLISIEQLADLYSGYAFFVSQEFQFDSRSPELLVTHKKHWFWGTLWNSAGIYRDVLLASFFINLFVIAQPLFVMNIYDRVVPNNAVDTLWVMASGVAIVFFFDYILKIVRGHYLETAGKKADIVLSAMIFEKVMSMKMDVMPESVGAFASNLREFDSVRNFLTSVTMTTFIDLPFFFLFIAVINYIAGPLVIVPIVAVIVILVYGFIIHFPLRKVVESTYRAAAQKNATLIESLTSIETLKCFNAENIVQRRWEDAGGFIAKRGLTARNLSNSINYTSGFVQQMAMIGTVVFGVYLISDNQMTMGALIATMILSSRTIQPMAQVANLTANYQQTKTALASLNDIMAKPAERDGNISYIHHEHFKGEVEFKNVSFSYPGQEEKALSGINIKINAGEKVAFIGRIGSGKTTIEKLIMGLYSPSDGAVKIDGLDLNQLDPANLRKNIGYVPQDIDLLHGTVKENIVLKAPYVHSSEMIRVADIAGVSQFVNKHPSGFDMKIGERGEGISGGQRQSIAVARSLLQSPPILLMDEPSNSMDNATEAELLKQLKSEISDRTFLLVTHRASLLKLVDRIIVIEHGSVIADGPKEQVLEALKQGKLHVRA
ncbi:MAG: type I secretion system permease/ATPase [gamma proteobacterium symbiont of Taylorina sp.]|nr:type I secretion system permease/ATPase [gamma proteobacterium symbiont of Taylorina sp.]